MDNEKKDLPIPYKVQLNPFEVGYANGVFRDLNWKPLRTKYGFVDHEQIDELFRQCKEFTKDRKIVFITAKVPRYHEMSLEPTHFDIGMRGFQKEDGTIDIVTYDYIMKL